MPVYVAFGRMFRGKSTRATTRQLQGNYESAGSFATKIVVPPLLILKHLTISFSLIDVRAGIITRQY